MRHLVRRRVRSRLIPELRIAHRFWSVRIAAAGMALIAIWNELPPSVQARLPHSSDIAELVIFLTVVARVLKQEKVDG